MPELFQRVRLEFRLWRTTPDGRTRGWIEQRIINDAGLLAHYVTDGANPLHTTIHHHGWIGDNPRGFAVDRELHARFEGKYVQARITLADLVPQIERQPRVLTAVHSDILEYLKASHTQVERLYDTDKRAAFGEMTTEPENKRFTVERLAFGARMLRDLWWTAWVTSAVG